MVGAEAERRASTSHLPNLPHTTTS